MKQGRVRILNEFLITQMNYLAFYPLGLTISTLCRELFSPERPSLLIWMFAGLIPFVLYFVRRKVHNFFLLIMMHLASVGIICGLSWIFSPQDNPVNRTYFIFVGIGFVIRSIHLRFTTEDFEDRALAIIFSVCAIAIPLFAQHYYENEAWDSYYVMTLILVLTIYFINSYLTNFLNFVKVNESSAGFIPEQEIYRSGFQLTMIFTIVGVVVLICTSQFTWLRDIIFAFMRLLVRFLNFIDKLFASEQSAESLVNNQNNIKENNNFSPPYDSSEPSPIWVILEGVVIAAVIAGLLFAIIYCMRKLIRFVREQMQKRGALIGETPAVNTVDVREKCEISKGNINRKKIFELFGFMDYGEKIRRIYKKTATGYKPHHKEFDSGRLPFYTAREMEQEMNSGAFAELYEKARYSNEECTPQDVKLMKAACK